MKDWFTPAEIAAARSPELPGTVRNINKLAEGWRADRAKARRATGKGGGWEYHISLLPPGAQARLQLLHRAVEPAAEPIAPASEWDRFEGLTDSAKTEAERRVRCLDELERLVAAGSGATAAAAIAAGRHGVSTATIFGWRKAVRGLPRAGWLAALAPAYQATATFADCHPSALDALKSDYLRPEKPSFSSCYRRMRKAASKQGWLPIPSERALRRRVDAEVPAGVITLARNGAKAAKALYPAQKRSRATLHAMQAFNMDGHELDVFVRLADDRVGRLHLLALQDLYSGKIVAWRLAETENKETVRLVIGDMVSAFGIPDTIVLDNGRAFTSKWISGRAPNRYRFKVREGDPQGLLIALGIEIRWAKPYSGQSKPIERAFRDLADTISKHPFCAGAYTGNRPEAKPENYGSRAVPLDAFRDHVAREIADHNARPGRRLETCAGRSFDETFAASMATSIVRQATSEQRSLWLLAAEKQRAQKGSGEIHFFGNRYWSAALNAHAGRQVVVRFDPDRLQEPVLVYAVDDRFICAAPCIQAVGFFDAEAARTHARDRGAFERALKEQKRLQKKMTADELARLYGAGERPAAPAAPARPAVTRLATAALPKSQPTEDFEASFSRGLRLFDDANADLGAGVVPLHPRR